VSVHEEVPLAAWHNDVLAWPDVMLLVFEHYFQASRPYSEALIGLGMEMEEGVGATGSTRLKRYFEASNFSIVR
jgi:hypothetical protein